MPITLDASLGSYALGKGVLCRGCAIIAALAIMDTLMPRSMGAMPSARPNIVIIFCDDLGYRETWELLGLDAERYEKDE